MAGSVVPWFRNSVAGAELLRVDRLLVGDEVVVGLGQDRRRTCGMHEVEAPRPASLQRLLRLRVRGDVEVEDPAALVARVRVGVIGTGPIVAVLPPPVTTSETGPKSYLGLARPPGSSPGTCRRNRRRSVLPFCCSTAGASAIGPPLPLFFVPGGVGICAVFDDQQPARPAR